jgi:hypothetical protein
MIVAKSDVARLWQHFDTWMFSNIDARHIATLRIGLSLVLVARLLHHDFHALAGQPDGLFRPLSYMKAFDAMPGETFTSALLMTALAGAICSAVGFRSHVALPVTTACSLILFGMTTSSGKVMHNDALLLLCLLPLSMAPASKVWSVEAWFRRRSTHQPTVHGRVIASAWPFRVAVLLVCGAYFFAGLAKLTHSGLDWVFSDNMRWILYANSDGRTVPNELSLFIADHPWLARISGAGIVTVELAFPLVLWKPALRYVFVPSVVAMHALTWFTLQLDYSAMAAVVVVVFVFWPGSSRSFPPSSWSGTKTSLAEG